MDTPQPTGDWEFNDQHELSPASHSSKAAHAAEPRLERLGDYRIVREVGRGGMGVVYEAVQESLGRRVALKQLPQQTMQNPDLKARFLQEAKAAARLHHTNIVPVFGFGEQHGVCYYVMQFIEGRGLDQVQSELLQTQADTAGDMTRTVASPPVPPTDMLSDQPAVGSNAPTGVIDSSGSDQDESEFIATVSPQQQVAQKQDPSATSAEHYDWVAQIGAQVADALAYAHSQGVHHRDIKPSNLILDQQGMVWLTDFGLAKAEGQENLTQTGSLIGTLRYMPPESFHGRADARGDMYSLGLTLYEMLALRPAFVAEDQQQLLRQVMHEVPPRIRSLNARVPRDLEAIIHKAIEQSPSSRYANAQEFHDDLQRYLQREPIRAKRIQPIGRVIRWCQRRPVVAGLTAALLLLLTVGFAVSTMAAIRFERLAQQRSEALVKYTEERNAKQQERMRAVKAEEVAQRNRLHAFYRSLTEAKVARLSNQVGQRFKSLDALQEASSLVQPLGLEEEVVREVRNELLEVLALPDLKTVDQWRIPSNDWYATVDPTLTRYAYYDHDGALHVCNVADRKETARLPSVKFAYREFSPNGRYLAFNISRIHCEVWQVAGSEKPRRVIRALRLPTDGTNSFGFAADGKWFVAAADDDQCTVTIHDLASGKPIKSWELGQPMQKIYPWGENRLLAIPRSSSYELELWDMETQQRVWQRRAPAAIDALAFSPDGERIALGCKDFDVHVWETTSGKELYAFRGHTNAGMQVQFDPAGRFLATGAWDGTTRLWDANSGRAILRAELKFDQFSANGQHLIFRDGGNLLGIWEVAQSEVRRQVTLFRRQDEQRINSVDIHPAGRLVASSDSQGVRLWDADSGEQLAQLAIDETAQVEFHRSGDYLVTSGRRSLWRWPLKLSAGQNLVQVGPPESCGIDVEEHLNYFELPAVNINSSGEFLTVNTRNRHGLVFPASAPGEWKLFEHSRLRHLDVSPDGRWVAAGCHNGPGVRIWQWAEGSEERHLLPEAYIAYTQFDPQGRWLATGTREAYQLWENGSWEPVWEVTREDDGSLPMLDFTADGRAMATKIGYRTIELFDLETKQPVVRLPLEDRALSSITACSISDRGDLLAMTNRHSITFWNLRLASTISQELNLAWNLPRLESRSQWQANQPLRAEVDLGSLRSYDLLAEAQTLYRQQQWEEALVAVTEATRLNPEYYTAWSMKRVLHERLGQRAHWLRATQQTLQLRPDLHRLLDRSARQLASMPLLFSDSARQAVLETGHEFPMSYALIPLADDLYVLASSEAALTEQALQWAQQAVQQQPEEADYWSTLGLAQYRHGNYQAALNALRQVSRHADASRLLSYQSFLVSMSYHRLGHEEKARQWHAVGSHYFTNTGSSIPHDLRMIQQESASQFEGEVPELSTVEVLSLVLEFSPEALWAWKKRAQVHRSQGNHEAVVADFTELLQRVPDNTYALQWRARSLSSLGHLERAIADFTKALSLAPDDLSLWYGRGKLYLQTDKLEQARDDWRQAVKLNDEHAPIWNRLGQLNDALGDHAEAVECYTRAMRLQPVQAPVYLYPRAIALARLERWEEAERDYRELIDNWSGRLAEYHGLLLTQLAQRDSESSRQTLKQAYDEFGSAEKPAVILELAIMASLAPAAVEDWDHWIAQAEAATQASAVSSQATLALGALHYRAGNYRQAMSHLESIQQLDDQQPTQTTAQQVYTAYYLTLTHRASAPSQAARQAFGRATAMRKQFVQQLEKQDRVRLEDWNDRWGIELLHDEVAGLLAREE